MAVRSNLIDNLNRLTEDDEGAVAEPAGKVAVASDRTDAQVVQVMQNVERMIPDEVVRLALIGFIEQRDLERVREARHRARPSSLQSMGEFCELATSGCHQ